MKFSDIQKRALEVSGKYDELNEKKSGKKWTKEQTMEGFVGDVGDLMKLVMAKSGAREIDDMGNKLKHELSDCLWSILVLADKYGVDLEKEFMDSMSELESRISRKLNQ